MNSPSLATSSSLLVFLSRNQLPRSWPNKLNFGVRACAMFGHASVPASGISEAKTLVPEISDSIDAYIPLGYG